MEVFITVTVVLMGLFSIGMFLVLQDKVRYIKKVEKELKKLETKEYKNSQEYTECKNSIEKQGIVEASVAKLFSMREESMKKLNAPNTLFLSEKVQESETDYLLKFALIHGYDNSENIEIIYEKIDPLMEYPADD